jgi:septum formation protein
MSVGLVLAVEPVEIDETAAEGEAVRDYVARMAEEKSVAATARLGRPELAVLAADTVVALGDMILGKPADEGQAGAMLRQLSGHRHEVLTAYRIQFGERVLGRSVGTHVHVRSLDAREITAYLASGEWRGKAGAYAIQGIAGSFVTDVQGSVTNVIGLPLAEALADLRALEALPRYPPAAFGVSPGANPRVGQ